MTPPAPFCLREPTRDARPARGRRRRAQRAGLPASQVVERRVELVAERAQLGGVRRRVLRVVAPAVGLLEDGLVAESGGASTLGRPEAGCWGRGKLPSCPGCCAPGWAGATWAVGATRRAHGAQSSPRVEGTFYQLVGLLAQPKVRLHRLLQLGRRLAQLLDHGVSIVGDRSLSRRARGTATATRVGE